MYINLIQIMKIIVGFLLIYFGAIKRYKPTLNVQVGLYLLFFFVYYDCFVNISSMAYVFKQKFHGL